ncbi:type II secretion system protein GspD [Polynucleobacter sp. 30F-ANTBAC]|uniref:type II secretion system protein GspD n=1 Tax=Polynucleobacter sp. 30F-ANTBAC TaxID=2689095 RepID=UPI001C0AF193|nr:type II secretion system protein GspD [Polynucleobacter sp. 30F-ANTBAC]
MSKAFARKLTNAKAECKQVKMGLKMILKKTIAVCLTSSLIGSSFANVVLVDKELKTSPTDESVKVIATEKELPEKIVSIKANLEEDITSGFDQKNSIESAGRYLQLPKYKENEISDFIDDVISELELKKGYKKSPLSLNNMKLPHQNLLLLASAKKLTKNGYSEIYFGYLPRERRLPLLWIHGVEKNNQTIKVNPDSNAAILDPIINSVFSETKKMKKNIGLSELVPKIINLSYTDADSALFLLRSMGYSVITDTDKLAVDDSFKADVEKLQTPGTAAIIETVVESQSDSKKSSEEGSDEEEGGSGGFGGFGGFGGGGGGASKTKKSAVKNLPSSIAYDKLPLIVKVPPPDNHSMGLVGAPLPSQGSDGGFGGGGFGSGSGSGAEQQGNKGGAIPNNANQLASPVSGGSGTQIMIMHHPSNIFQYSEVKKVLDQVIDKPVKQVYVEGLILEISKKAISELGVQWGNQSGKSKFTLGTLNQLSAGVNTPAGQFIFDSTATATQQFMAKINALIDEDKAEVLSRPSILTLDNRQAVIRVGTDIPIATSIDAPSSGGASRVAFSFSYQPTGILLNIRPKISDDQKEVSMIIDATVSDRVPGADLRITDTNGATLASAPTISTRKIQTYARIYNNNPLIIGGLVNKTSIKGESKVPLLGDIPLLGNLFGYKSDAEDKTEVIIVLTPTVLTEEYRATKAQYPKDDNRFDQFGTQLFRESYRIRAEDLIDSQYIRANQRLVKYRNLVNIAIKNNPSLTKQYPFSQLQGTKVPGEFIFVTGMMSRMLERLNAHQNVNIDKLMFFESSKSNSYSSISIGDILKRYGDGKSHESFFSKNSNKALVLTFKYARDSKDPGAWAQEPKAEVKLVDCVNREQWKSLVWEANQPVNGQQNSYSIVIHHPDDLERLKLAITTKNTVLANGNEQNIIFDNFLPGRMIAMQEVSPSWERMLEASVARYYFYSLHYYGAFTNALEKTLQDVETKLSNPEFEKLLVDKKFN